MRHRRIGLIIIAIHFFLAVMPCSGGTPTPGGSTPEIQFTNPPDIVLPPVAYTGPDLDDIGLKLISFTGPDLTDITLPPVSFSQGTLSVNQPPTLSGKTANAFTMQATPIPGTQPRIKILSPKPGQTVRGNVLLDVNITGWQGTPGVSLDWWWSAPTPAGQWPAPPKRMTVAGSLNGKSRITIPASAFPKQGLWRVKASVQVSENRRVFDDVSFTLAGGLKPYKQTTIMKTKPKQTLPGKTSTQPAVGRKPQLRPVAPDN